MKFQIFIAELQNYTVNVEGHNLHQMPLQRVPGNGKNKSNIKWLCEHCKSVLSKDNIHKISALEEKTPEEAIKLYDEACSLLEEDGKEQMAFDLYRSAAALYVKLEK
jgi:hypothetical protein